MKPSPHLHTAELADDAAVGRSPMLAIAGSIAAGVVWGALDLLGQRELPYPWANLANSLAVWAIFGFAVGASVRVSSNIFNALAAVVALLVAVESYYVTAAVVQHDSWSNLSSETAVAWLVFAVIAGVVFGTAGRWWRAGSTWQRVTGVAVAVAVFLAEAALFLTRPGNGHTAENTQTAFIEIALAAVVLVVTTRRIRPALVALCASLPFAVIGYVLLHLVGFGGVGS